MLIANKKLLTKLITIGSYFNTKFYRKYHSVTGDIKIKNPSNLLKLKGLFAERQGFEPRKDLHP